MSEPTVVPFRPGMEDRVIELIVSIQRAEFSIPITAEEQPDLRSIPSYYQVGAGNFWVALAGERVVGTIGLLGLGNAQGALRKMFVHADWRGAVGTAPRLLAELLAFASAGGLREIFLGTTEKFLAAHRFYAKHGFGEIPASALPASFPRMQVDTRFFRRELDEPRA